MTNPKPIRHRAPVRALHGDGTTCTHRQPRRRDEQPNPECPGRTGYTATCSAGDFTLTNGIRAYVEEQASYHARTTNEPKVTR
ncbi:hypothetical protein ACGFJC_47160 [Nonomuraea fuscirosea]|uniref:hypothetical protein n=1 Tax=Nonomuraea fuscirosea TaxID=1291556 RepID=UPI00372404AD